MPKMQVYLPEALYQQVKAKPGLNVSGILQEALTQRLAELDRLAAMDEAIADYEAEFGKITQEAMDQQVAADLASAVYPVVKRKRSAAG